MKPFEIDLSYIRSKQVKPPVDVYTEPKVVCHAMDVHEYEMKEFDFLKDKKVLVVKQRGRIYALGNTCPHFNAPLVKGVLGDGHIRCPWHGACFNLETGDIEDFPGINSLPRYKVEVERGGLVMIRAKVKDLQSSGCLQKMVKHNPENQLLYIIVGGGASAQMCAETLRKEGFTGRILMICKESYLPYDRTALTKDFGLSISKIEFRSKEFYDEYNIEMLLNTEVVKANMDEKSITTSYDKRLNYDKMFIATGGSARKLYVKGTDLKNVFTMRDFDDMVRIREALKDKNVVCVGSSYIILEIAQTLRSCSQAKVTVVARSQVPMLGAFGLRIGERILKLFRDNMITMLMNTTVVEIIGDSDGNIIQITLSDGQLLPCQALIIGIGMRCNTDFLIGSGLPINANGSIEADMYLKTFIDDVFVGGDVANAPVYSDNNRCSLIGHNQMAQYHGRIAAINMAGSRLVDLRSVPFYSTRLFKHSFRSAGNGRYADLIIEGDLDNFDFVAYYLDDLDKVISVVACNRDPLISQFAELRSQGRILRRDDLLDKKKPWTTRLKGPIKCY
uniref:Rieske domain-containing protein n=1 Tax=Glossina brevipalpis TaxID=37001 RepID=A0A1A9WK93_9MUSC